MNNQTHGVAGRTGRVVVAVAIAIGLTTPAVVGLIAAGIALSNMGGIGFSAY